MSGPLLVLTLDHVGPAMAGPAIRATEIARHVRASLGRHVVLAAPALSDIDLGEGVELISYEREPRRFRQLACASRDVVVQGTALEAFPWLQRLDGRLIVDLYDPFHLENLELYPAAQSGLAQDRLDWDLSILTRQLRVGDFFLCASERQRDYWLGMLTAVGRLTAADHGLDPTLRRLIDVVPYGMPDRPPQHTRQVLKGVHPGISPTAKVLLWGGGVWDWLDPFTPIQAVARLSERDPDIRLFFMGTRRPGQTNAGRRSLGAAQNLAKQLGVLDRTVFFNDWVAYADRENFLLEADVGITLARAHLEHRYAFRARMLDYVWADLPIVCTAGDVLADRVAQYNLGFVVGTQDVNGFAEACRRILSDPGTQARARHGRELALAELHWTSTIRPLITFLQTAPTGERRHRAGAPEARRLSQPALLARLAWQSFRLGGAREVSSATWRYMARYRLLGRS